jgi:hypothetical protein
MTPGDMLRDWAVRLRSVCESADADRATLRLQGGQVVSYELGEGFELHDGGWCDAVGAGGRVGRRALGGGQCLNLARTSPVRT